MTFLSYPETIQRGGGRGLACSAFGRKTHSEHVSATECDDLSEKVLIGWRDRRAGRYEQGAVGGRAVRAATIRCLSSMSRMEAQYRSQILRLACTECVRTMREMCPVALGRSLTRENSWS